MANSEILFHGGLIAMGVTIIVSACTAVLHWTRARRLKRMMDQEYGERT